jgi:hypothetical protein
MANKQNMPRAMPWLRRVVTGVSLKRPGSVHVGFVAVKVALGQVFLEVLHFPLSTSVHHGHPYLYIIWGMNNGPVGGGSSET